MGVEPRKIDELVILLADQCSVKNQLLQRRPFAFFLQSFMGGSMVAFGVILGLSVSAGVPWPGIANILMGLVFGFSLVIILNSEASLVTADMVLGFIGLFHRRITGKQYLKFLSVSYIGNAIGSLVVTLLVFIGGSGYNLEPWLVRAHEIATLKTGMSSLQTFLMACLCTWILQTAVFLYFKNQTDIGKMGMAFYGPLAFVAGMTEHSIANIGFIALPILQQTTSFVDIPGMVLTQTGETAKLTWGFARYGWAHNQLFTLMGNFIGGTLFVGLILHFVSTPSRVMLLYRKSVKQISINQK